MISFDLMEHYCVQENTPMEYFQGTANMPFQENANMQMEYSFGHSNMGPGMDSVEKSAKKGASEPESFVNQIKTCPSLWMHCMHANLNF